LQFGRAHLVRNGEHRGAQLESRVLVEPLAVAEIKVN
jgi:hypothetical protein